MNTKINREKTEGCDEISWAYCENFNALQPLFLTEGNVAVLGNIQIKLDNMDVFDRAALGLYIGKFVEQEINSSVVQLMRYVVGIDMPEFFCKRDPSFWQDEVKVGNRIIRLNRQADPAKRESLATIPAGDAYYALEELKKESDVFEDYNWLYEREFLDAWRKLFGFRNRVAHIGHLITQEELDEAYGWFEAFLKYMPEIKALKVDLAPDGMFDEDEVECAEKQHDNKEPEEQEAEKPRPTTEEFLRARHLYWHYVEITEEENVELRVLCDNYDWFSYEFCGANGKKGMLNPDGSVLVPALYDDFAMTYNCLTYHFSVIPAYKNGKCGLVKCDGTGEPVTEFIYDMIQDIPWHNYMFFYKKGGSLAYGILRDDGKEICPCIIDSHYEPLRTCMIFKSGDYYGLYDKCDKIVMPMFDNIEVMDLYDPLVVTLNGIKGYLDDKTLKFVPKSEVDAIEDEDDRHDRMLDLLPADYELD